MKSAVPETNFFMERLRSRFFEERERFFSGSCGVRGPRSGDLAASGDLALSGGWALSGDGASCEWRRSKY